MQMFYKDEVGLKAGKRMKKKLGLCLLIPVLFIIGSCLMLSATPAQSEEGNKNKVKLDVVLIIDNSGSMRFTDPNQLRIKAAQAFVGYLRLNEDKLDARVSVVLFGGALLRIRKGDSGHDADLVQPLTPVLQDREIREKIYAKDMGCTNFPKALETAYSAFEEEGFPSDRRRTYILFTDGRPEPQCGFPDPREFEKIKEWVEKFRVKSSQFYVIAIGDAVMDEERWKEFTEGPQKDQSGQLIKGYRSLGKEKEAIKKIYEIYHDILMELTGADLGEPCPGIETGAANINIEPYLQKVIFAIVKWRNPKDVIVEIYKPDGSLLKSDPPNAVHTGGGPDWDEGFSVINPPPGSWKIIAKGGSVSCWADRYFIDIEKSKPAGDHIAGEPIEIEARLVDTGGKIIKAIAGYPRSISAILYKKGLPEEKLEITLNESPDGIFTGKLPEQEEGDYILKLIAKAHKPAEITLREREYDLFIGEFPYIEGIVTHDAEVNNKVPVDVFVGRLQSIDDIDKNGQLDIRVLARWEKGPEASGYLSCPLVVNNQFRCEVGNILPNSQVEPFGEDDHGRYEVEVRIEGQTSKGQFFPPKDITNLGFRATKSFCVTEPRDKLPLPDVDKAKVTLDQEGEMEPKQGEEAFLRVPIKNFEKTTPEKLTVKAIVTDPNGKKIQLVNLNWVNKNLYEGELEPFVKAGKYSAQIAVQGTTPDGCPISLMQQAFSFLIQAPPLPLPAFLLRLFMHYGLPSAGVLSFLTLAVWYFFFRPRPIPVEGRLIITDPLGNELPPFDLYGRGARISIGSEGIVPLDPTLDSSVAGVVAELRAKVVGRRRVVRSVWYKTGDKFEEGQEIYHGDEFSVGRFRLKYENLAAEREVISEILETE